MCLAGTCGVATAGLACSKNKNCDKFTKCVSKVCKTYKDIGESCVATDLTIPSGFCAKYTPKGGAVTGPFVVKAYTLGEGSTI